MGLGTRVRACLIAGVLVLPLAGAIAAPLAQAVEDADSDGIEDGADNCPADANADQANFDVDPQGDVCDPDDDDDGVDDLSDLYPFDVNEWSDADGDGLGDNADPDDDDDGLPDSTTSSVFRVRGRGGIILPAGLMTVTGCDLTVGPTACTTYAVPSSGELTLFGDPTHTYTIKATAYKRYVSATLPVTGDMTLVVPTAGPPRTVTGTVLVNGLPESDAGILSCSFPVGTPQPNCTGAGQGNQFGLADLSGDVSFSVNSYVRQFLVRFADGGGPVNITTPLQVPPGSATDTATFSSGTTSFTRPENTVYSGTISRTGFDGFAQGQAGVFACPQPAIFPPNSIVCVGVRFQVAAADGSYRLRLSDVPPVSPTQPNTFTGWRLGAYIIVDGAPVVCGVTETIGTAPLGAVSRDFSADCVPPPGSTPESVDTGPVTVSVSPGTVLHNVTTVPIIAVLTPLPPSATFSHGVQSFTAELTGAATVATVTLQFDDPIPANAQWYKLRDGEWTVYPSLRLDDNTLQLSIEDGSFGDDDHIVNGFVTDPGALGVPIGNNAPSITVPDSISADAIGTDVANVTYSVVGSDPEDGSLVPVCEPASGSDFAVGATAVTCTVTDAGGLMASAAFTVTVVDVDLDNNGVRDTTPPTNKDQCKGTGWRSFDNPSFRNQGDCVSAVQSQRP